MGGWQDSQLIGIARCKMIGKAHDFAWWDDNVAAATTFSEFKTLALKRFDTEPLIFKVERFRNARQNAGQEARSFANRVRLLGTATLAGYTGEDSAKAQLRREILAEQMLSQFLTGLRDPVRRFVLSRDPKTFDEAIDVAAREELNEKLSRNHTVPVRHIEQNADAQELRSRLDRLEKLLEESKAGVPAPPNETKVVEADGSDIDGLAEVPTLKAPRDDETVPVGVASLKLKEVRFCEEEVVGVLVDTSVVHQTMAGVDEVEECHDCEGVVFVEPKGNCSTLDEYRAELKQRKQRPHKIVSPTPRSTAELSKWVFGPFNEDPKLKAGEEVYMREEEAAAAENCVGDTALEASKPDLDIGSSGTGNWGNGGGQRLFSAALETLRVDH
ncbi:hypothetical protein MTO96_044452 [Rhipicephalus appendiculatus]